MSLNLVSALVDFNTAKQEARWGTYGRGGAEHCNGTCPKHKLSWKRLIDCSTSHLQKILQNQRQICGTVYETLIHSILKDRGVEPKTFDLVAERALFNSARAVRKISNQQ